MSLNERGPASGVPVSCIALLISSALALGAGCMGSPGPAGKDGAPGLQGIDGPAGPQGAPGVDGTLRVFGDGSAGAGTFTTGAVLSFADANTQYADVTVGAGTTLQVPSGLVIRCTGAFTNNGTIVIGTASFGGGLFGVTPSSLLGTYPAAPGIAMRPAGNGDTGDNTLLRYGGARGVGLGAVQARMLLRPGPLGGGAGFGALFAGGGGGGNFTVFARGAVTNAGTITADGAPGTGTGAGGGGGGIVVLASLTSVSNTGTINAEGGDGQNNDTQFGIGGGGGGGIIHLLAPSASSSGPLNVAGGVAGVATGLATFGVHGGGGGGGASGGNGGGGGSVNPNSGTNPNQPNAAGAGSPGYTFLDRVDPTALF